MAVMYPKCSHSRPLDTVMPDWRCHACSIRHLGLDGGSATPSRPARAAHTDGRRSSALGAACKMVVLVALAWGLSLAVRHSPSGAAHDVVVLPDAALHMPDAESSLLRSMPGRLALACDRTKDSPSQRECRARLHARSNACIARVAQQYPELPGDSDRMAAIIHTYQRCIFEH